MKTLKEHNEAVAKEWEKLDKEMELKLMAGIACDECGVEMRYSTFTQCPSERRDISCPGCGEKGVRESVTDYRYTFKNNGGLTGERIRP